MAVLEGHDGEISNVQFNWDSSLVGSSSLDGSAKLWDARHTSCLATVSGHTDEVNLISRDVHVCGVAAMPNLAWQYTMTEFL